MRIVSWNVNGIRSIIKKDFKESIDNMNPDILCLQETKAQKSQVAETLAVFRNYELLSNSAEKKGYSGVSFLLKIFPMDVKDDMGVSEHDSEGRIITAEFEDFYLVNVYVPNSGVNGLGRLDYRQKWDRDFLKFLKDFEKKKPVIACGDFNVAHRPIDIKNDKSNYNKSAGYTQPEIDGMDNYINAGFVDIFRHLHPEKVAYTYFDYRFQARERNVGWRIDYFLISPSLVDKVKSAEIYSEFYGSDHCPIGLDIEF
ncbi:MAG: exodeoxyribonuclease III [Gillisia sp.]